MKIFIHIIFILFFSSTMWGQQTVVEDTISFPGLKDTTIQRDSSEYRSRAAILLKEDTLFYIYDKIFGYAPFVRARYATEHIQEIVERMDFLPDSFRILENPPYHQIYYGDEFVLNVSAKDAEWYGKSQEKTAEAYLNILINRSRAYASGLDVKRLLIQIGLALLVVLISGLIIRYVNRLFKFFAIKARRLQGVYLKSITIRNYELITEERLMSIVQVAINVLRILFLLFLFYLTLPVLFSIFPWTEGIANTLFGYILNPLKRTVMAIVSYLPNLFTIIVIFFVVRYITRGINFLAHEIETEKLKITNFYPDWAVPTARIANFMLYAFMLVLIWPYLPGSESDIFKGISVFLGLLISLGSSSAIANVVAGLVITYMRPYKIGDRVKIAETVGDIVEKNLLVTRVKTIKNEIITVPNSTVLNNSSVNFSASMKELQGLVIHTTITIGYDVPWRKVHAMLIEAAVKTPLILEAPKPFVLQTALNDFAVAYQINAYTDQPNRQAQIYSDLHSLIQDVFAKNEVEIMSPTYQAYRKGPSTVPPPRNAKQ